ncbi:MAG: glycosyltransferase [Bacillota bacterium]
MELWLQALVGLLALYGAVTLVVSLYGRARTLVAQELPSCFISLLLVTRDREQVIEGMVRDMTSLLSGLGERNMDFEIIAVDDRSRDDTALILERLARKNRALRVVRVADTGGESAVQVGLVLCRSKVVLLCEAVGKAEPRLLLSTLERLLNSDIRLSEYPLAARCS